jgi:hypothetical protein
LEKEEGNTGVCSKVYLKQVLESIIFFYFAAIPEDKKVNYIFIEDSSKIYKSYIQLPKLNTGICRFDWLLSSSDLNPC